MQSKRASDHDTVTMWCNMKEDHWCLCHESLGNTSDRKTFIPQILFPKMGEHFMRIRSFQFNGRSLAADIHYAEMIIVVPPQRCEFLFRFRKSYYQPPVRCKTERMNFSSTGY